MVDSCGRVAVRHILEHRAADAEHLYEERITLWFASEMDAAIEQAEAEVADYCAALGCEDTGLYQAYLLADDPGATPPGIEIFSLMRTSSLSSDEYLTVFFATGQELQSE